MFCVAVVVAVRCWWTLPLCLAKLLHQIIHKTNFLVQYNTSTISLKHITNVHACRKVETLMKSYRSKAVESNDNLSKNNTAYKLECHAKSYDVIRPTLRPIFYYTVRSVLSAHKITPAKRLSHIVLYTRGILLDQLTLLTCTFSFSAIRVKR